MPFSSTRPLALCTALMAAAVIAIPLNDAQAAARPNGVRPVQTFRPAPVFRPQQRFVAPRQPQRFTPQVHVNRPVQQFNRPVQQFNRPATTQQFNHNPNLLHGNPNFRPNIPGNQHALPAFTPKPGLSAQALKFGPGKQVSLKPGATLKPAFPVVSMHNKFWPVLKGPKFIWFAGHRRFFIPVGVLGVVLIGGSYWYPDGYVSIAGPLCTGFTPDGCQLEWREVNFEDGGSAPQCVQYCPQAGPPPAQVVTLPPPPALLANGSCQLTIYADPDFGGLSAPTSDNQPLLSETGWKDEIASIQVQAGTWDFYTAENFGGETIRMNAGSYPMLAPEWNKRIGSFMCVEPGAPGA